MEAPKTSAGAGEARPRIDWESVYRNYRKPGYVPGFEIVNKLGGGVFGNSDQWITDAIERAFQRHLHFGLDIRVVSYRQSKPAVAELISRLNG